MGPERERRHSGETAPAAAGSVVIASIATWLLCVVLYSVLFTLSGFPVPAAIRGALANCIPDGLLALAVFRAARRIDWARAASLRLLRIHAPRALFFVGLAFAGKTLLFWFDMTVVRGEGAFRLVAGVVAWQIFVSVLLYVAVTVAAHAWLTARRLREEEAHVARAESRSAQDLTSPSRPTPIRSSSS